MKTGIQLIAAERRRQVSKEGWTTAHDDTHTRKQMAKAAESYLAAHIHPDLWAKEHGEAAGPTAYWPWAKKWWKPSDDPVRNLVKAGALIAAEIDRLQRRPRKPANNNKKPTTERTNT